MSHSSFLYPFLDDDGGTAGAELLGAIPLADVGFDELVASARSSWLLGLGLDHDTVQSNTEALDRAATLLIGAANAGRTVFAIGNGGSACDADRLVRLITGVVPARSLLDPALLSALANDVGAARLFDRQIETYVAASDVVVAFSTSGTSVNILAAIECAHRRGAKTIVFAGYGGASLQQNPCVDVCLSVESASVHRIQESQGALTNELVSRVRALLETDPTPSRPPTEVISP